uniref:Uncharacterized protein n=1 Tax=Meloidogyne enterolobii TaxID=390850 RepID=A0A6V7VSI5_MELEN|nr:unnamed protein product [Meloidogyne enterolobii]
MLCIGAKGFRPYTTFSIVASKIVTNGASNIVTIDYQHIKIGMMTFFFCMLLILRKQEILHFYARMDNVKLRFHSGI